MNTSDNFHNHRKTSIAENDRKALATRKKMGLNQNAHEVSQEFRDLGYMTKNGRKHEYVAQEGQDNFSYQIRTIQPRQDFVTFK